MKCQGMKIIRNKQRISRRQMSRDLDIPVQTIKDIEDNDIKDISMDLIDKIANYLQVDAVELVIPDLSQRLDSIKIPNGASLDRARQVFRSLFKKYNLLENVDQLDTFLAELKYRLGDLPVEDTFKDNTNSHLNKEHIEVEDFLNRYKKHNLDDVDEDNFEDYTEGEIMSVCKRTYNIYKRLKQIDPLLQEEDISTLIHIILDIL